MQRNDDVRSFALAVMPLLLCAVTGCSTVTPASFGAKAPSISGEWSGPVAVNALHTGEPASRLNANGMEFDIDLHTFSDHLAELLRTSLRDSGTEMGPGGKEIHLEVEYLDFMYQGPCLLDYTVQLGETSVFGLQSSGASSNFAKACRSALESAVLQILRDQRTRAYMRGE